jgi:hypothetical protein
VFFDLPTTGVLSGTLAGVLVVNWTNGTDINLSGLAVQPCHSGAVETSYPPVAVSTMWEASGILATSVSVAAVASGVPSAALDVSRFVVLLRVMSCTAMDTRNSTARRTEDASEHPVQVSVVSEWKTALDLGFLACIAVVHVLALIVRRWWRGRTASSTPGLLPSLGVAVLQGRFPGIYAAVVARLLSPMASSMVSSLSTLGGPTVSSALAGAFYFLFLAAYFAGLYAVVVLYFAAVDEEISTGWNEMLSTLVADTIRWVDLPQPPAAPTLPIWQGFCTGFGNVFDQYCPGRRWFGLLDCGTVVALAAVAGIPATSTLMCTTISGVVAGLVVVEVCLVLYLSPCHTQRTQLLKSAVALCHLAMAIVVFAYHVVLGGVRDGRLTAVAQAIGLVAMSLSGSYCVIRVARMICERCIHVDVSVARVAIEDDEMVALTDRETVTESKPSNKQRRLSGLEVPLRRPYAGL